MDGPATKTDDPTKGQRGALADSERRATETEPQNFRDEANADKVVEIAPVETGEPSAIRGIDPKR